ncbi:hypothetical protein U1Q18_034679 [Sarracenia purpurea var. burkii]
MDSETTTTTTSSFTETTVDHFIPPKSQAQSFLIANGTNHSDQSFQIADIEMVAFRALTYTSLKDILPASPPMPISPLYDRKDSWREIPIKDPLLQHAAWAYLQPMSTAQESDDRSCAAKLKDSCLGLFGCFGGLLSDVVATTIKMLFSVNKKGR